MCVCVCEREKAHVSVFITPAVTQGAAHIHKEVTGNTKVKHRLGPPGGHLVFGSHKSV